MSVYDTHVQRATQADLITITGYAEGANDADMTIQEGVGVKSIKRTGEGLYTITFNTTFPALVSWSFGFGADTAADVKGYTCVVDVDAVDLSVSEAIVKIAITNASETLADLIVNQFLSFEFKFRRATVKN